MLLSIASAVQAQLTKGDKFVGGYFTFSDSKTPDKTYIVNSHSNSLQISPLVGFVLNEKLAVGGLLGYSTSASSSSDPNGTDYSTNSWLLSAGAFVQRYFPLSDKVVVAMRGAAQFSRGKSTSFFNGAGTSSDSDNSYSLGISVSPVFIFFPSKRWGFEAGVGQLSYLHSYSFSTMDAGNSFALHVGTFSLGVAYYFR